jgi:4-amino-4-deoxy-L-arabinose transferase-like glycosyltransferase/tetratricopeptide (TPR) repeat protein
MKPWPLALKKLKTKIKAGLEKPIDPAFPMLGLLMLAGLCLRWWGVNWERFHPDEWTAYIIHYLAKGHWFYPHEELWHQAFFGLGALCYSATNWCYTFFLKLLGPPDTLGVQLNVLLFGRAFSGILSSLNVLAGYGLARSLSDSKTTGLVVAALIAFSPLLVGQSHYLTVDASLPLIITLALWSAVKICKGAGLWHYVLAGLSFGVAVTTKSNALVIAPTFLLAHFFVTREKRPAWAKWGLAQPACFGGGSVLGLVLGYPGFLVNGADIINRYLYLFTKYTKPRFSEYGSWLDSPLADRLGWSLGTMDQSIGLALIALALIGLGLALLKREKAVIVVGSYPVIFYLAYLLIANRLGERDHTSLVPPLACLAGWCLYRLARKFLPRPGLRIAVIGLAGGALALVSGLRAAEVSYIFWQDDTRVQASQWINHTLPLDATVFVGRYGPEDLTRKLGNLDAITNLKPGQYINKNNYAVYSSLGEASHFHWFTGNTYTKRGEVAKMIPRDMELIKEFDLKTPDDWRKLPGKRPFPIFASPLIRVYSTLPKRPVIQPIPLGHPSQLTNDKYLFAETNNPDYSQNNALVITGHTKKAERVLRPPEPLEEVLFELIHLGEHPVEVHFDQGPLKGTDFILHPGQIKQKFLKPMCWPPQMERIYPFEINLGMSQPVMMNLISEPLFLGLKALETGCFSKAESILTRAAQKQKKAFFPKALMAAALYAQGKNNKAAALLDKSTKDFTIIKKLAFSPSWGEEWLEELTTWTGHYPSLLLNGLTRHYRINPYILDEVEETHFKGEGYTASSQLKEKQLKHVLKVWLADVFPAEPLSAKFTLAWHQTEPEATNGKITLEVLRHNQKGIFAEPGQLIIDPDQMQGARGKGEFDLMLPPREFGTRWEIRLTVPSDLQVTLKEITMQTSPKAMFARSTRWVFLARAGVWLSQGQTAKAADLLNRLAKTDPNFLPALKPQVEALLALGQVKKALARLDKAEHLLATRPELLKWAIVKADKFRPNQTLTNLKKRWQRIKAALETAEFEEGLSLIKTQISRKKIKPGEKTRLTLVWRADETPPANYCMVVHVKGPKGLYIFDHHLSQKKRAFNRLEKGQVTIDSHFLALPKNAPQGNYEVRVGLMRQGAEERRIKLVREKRLKIVKGTNQGKDYFVAGSLEVSS